MSNLKIVDDDDHFHTLMNTSGDDVVVVDFYTSWCGPCKQMEPFIQSLSMKYPAILFLKVDADKCFDTAMEHGLRGVPLFVIYMNRKIVDKILLLSTSAHFAEMALKGAQPQELDRKISLYENEFMRTKSSSSNYLEDVTKSLSKFVTAVGRIEDVSKYFVEGGCKCINDLAPSPIDNFIGGKKLISGNGTGRMAICYSFSEKLILHSFKIKAKPECAPKVLRFFVNQPKILDFNITRQLVPAQEVTLGPEDVTGETAIEFRSGAFNLVQHLQVFVLDAMQRGSILDHKCIEIDSFQIYGAPVALTSPDAQNRGYMMQRNPGSVGMKQSEASENNANKVESSNLDGQEIAGRSNSSYIEELEEEAPPPSVSHVKKARFFESEQFTDRTPTRHALAGKLPGLVLGHEPGAIKSVSTETFALSKPTIVATATNTNAKNVEQEEKGQKTRTSVVASHKASRTTRRQVSKRRVRALFDKGPGRATKVDQLPVSSPTNQGQGQGKKTAPAAGRPESTSMGTFVTTRSYSKVKKVKSVNKKHKN